MARITIVGLGLIGGSLGLAIRAQGREDLEVVGFDTDQDVMQDARRLGAVDTAVESPESAVQGAALVIVAVPPLAMESVFQRIAGRLAHGAAVTDTASTKSRVMEWAERLLPETVSYVGGHPMAGKSDQGIANADADLFRDRPYALVPAATASSAAVDSVSSLVRSIGARELFIDADEHDRLVAAVSHLPLTASTALFTLLRRSPGWDDFARISGPAYRDLTRLASGDPRMAADIAVTNRENVQYWIDRYVAELQRFRDLLDRPREEIEREFAGAQRDRRSFESAESDADRQQAELPSVGSQVGGMLFGGRLYERLRRLGGPA